MAKTNIGVNIMDFPTVRIDIELDRMKHSIMIALLNQSKLLNETMQQAVDKYCTKDNLDNLMYTEVRRIMDEAIKEEVRLFFRNYSYGRAAIREAVQSHLNDCYPPIEKE